MMSESAMETLARRLDRVEQENRRLKRAGVVALTVIVAVVLMGQTSEKFSPEVLYKRGLVNYISKDYDGAIKIFRTYLDKFPNAKLAGNSQYWMAESYYSKREYTEAIRHFEVLINKYPDSEKRASALLKMGFALLEVGEESQGKSALKKVVMDFPGSREAKIALRRLGGEPMRTTDPSILSYCKRVAGESYSLLEACIRREEEAKRRLGF